MSIWFCSRLLTLLQLSSGWRKLICHKMMQWRRCHLIKESSIWRNIWAPDSWCSISSTKLIQNKVSWLTNFLNFLFKRPFYWDFLSWNWSARELFLILASSILKEIQNSSVISEIEDESELTWHKVQLARVFLFFWQILFGKEYWVPPDFKWS